MKFFILGAIALASQVVWAANAPTKLNLQTIDSKFITVNNKDQAVVLKNLEVALKQISGGSLDLPATIGLVIPQTFDSPFFDPMALTLVAPYQMVIDGKSKHPIFTRAVELHEFGHAIFNENMELILKQDPALLKRWTNVKKMIVKTAPAKLQLLKRDVLAEMLAKKIEATKASGTSEIMAEFETVKSSLMNEEEKLMSVYVDNQDKLQEMGELFQALTPFNEFFADVVSVVVTEDPQSIADALHFSNVTMINYQDRSFSRRRSRRPQDGEAHNFYSLSRHYIYKYYLSHPSYKAKGKAWLIRKTLDSVSCGIHSQEAVVSQLEKQVQDLMRKNPKFDVKRFVVEKMNDALDTCIDKNFK